MRSIIFILIVVALSEANKWQHVNKPSLVACVKDERNNKPSPRPCALPHSLIVINVSVSRK